MVLAVFNLTLQSVAVSHYAKNKTSKINRLRDFFYSFVKNVFYQLSLLFLKFFSCIFIQRKVEFLVDWKLKTNNDITVKITTDIAKLKSKKIEVKERDFFKISLYPVLEICRKLILKT